MSVVTADGLTRRFDDLVAVDDLTLELPGSGVIGLVGPNGSGKSTLIRMLLGLIAPTSGRAEVLGRSIERPADYLPQVGALVESPAFVAGLSARRNLQALARLRGLPDARVDEVLDIVGLAGRDREAVRRFSLGMKQRLGIAAALLPDPALLLLDEPTNGLDPSGIVEIRALLRRLAEEGRAVVVSSHLLSEIEAACDWVIVMRFGTLVFNGAMAELLSRTGHHVRIVPETADDLDDLRRVVGAAGWHAADVDGGLHVDAGPEESARINAAAAEAGIALAEVVRHQERLEDVFLRMTGGDDRETAAERAAAATGERA